MRVNRATSVFSRIFLALILATLAFEVQAAPFTLTVGNGSGAGIYEEGSQVTIWANPQEDPDPAAAVREPLDPSQPMRIFERWSGDTAFVEDIHSPQTRVQMPDHDITLVAEYKDAPRWVPNSVLTYFPNGYHSVLFLFHGGAGCATCILARTEVRMFVDEALSQGYAIVVPESYDRFAGKWDGTLPAENNLDMARMAELRRDLIARGRMRASDPVFLLGLSGGGMFASLWDQYAQDLYDFPVEAMALYVSPGTMQVMYATTVPTIFATAIHDDMVPYDSVVTSYSYLLASGTPTRLLVSQPTPLYPERFWRIDAIDADDSRAIYQSLVDAGVVDGQGNLLVHPSDLDLSMILPVEYLAQSYEIQKQLEVAYAAHTFMGHFNKPVLDFLQSPATVIDLPPYIGELQPTSGYPGTQVSIRGQDFVDIQSVAFNGVEASFIYVSAVELRAVVPAGASTGPVTVTNSVGTATSAEDFQVMAAAIEGFEPTSGRPGTLVTISGIGLSDVSEVRFNGVGASFTLLTGTTLIATVPDSATTGPIELVSPIGVSVSGEDFVVPPPSILGIAPIAGAPGTWVTISGTDMVNVQSVTFNGVAASSFTSIGPETLLASVPDGASAGPIRVENPQGTAASPDDFQVVPPPSISSLSTNKGSAGDEVAIDGSGLGWVSSVTFGGVEAQIIGQSDTRITVLVPNAGTGFRLVKAMSPGGTASGGFFRIR